MHRFAVDLGRDLRILMNPDRWHNWASRNLFQQFLLIASLCCYLQQQIGQKLSGLFSSSLFYLWCFRRA